MATHSSVLAWRIPGTGEPGGLPSMGSRSRTRLKRLSSSSWGLALLLESRCHSRLRAGLREDATLSRWGQSVLLEEVAGWGQRSRSRGGTEVRDLLERGQPCARAQRGGRERRGWSGERSPRWEDRELATQGPGRASRATERSQYSSVLASLSRSHSRNSEQMLVLLLLLFSC